MSERLNEIPTHLLELISDLKSEVVDPPTLTPPTSPPQHVSERDTEVFLPSQDELLSILTSYRHPSPNPFQEDLNEMNEAEAWSPSAKCVVRPSQL